MDDIKLMIREAYKAFTLIVLVIIITLPFWQ